MQAYGQAFARVYNLKWNRFAQALAPQILTLHERTWPEQANPGTITIDGYAVGKSLLDLCCGNGILAHAFLEQGYRVAGLDLSKHMLCYAKANNAESIALGQATFVQGDAASFELDQRFALVVSTFDALNHLPGDEALQSCFRCVSRVLLCGGLFVFDLNTREGLRRWGDIGIEEDLEATIIHRGVYAPQDGKAWAQLSGFVRLENGLYERFEETVYNTIFEMASVRRWLLDLGFRDIYFARSGDLVTAVEDPEALPRVFVIARKPLAGG